MTIDPTRLVGRIARAVAGVHEAGLLQPHLRGRLAICGAQTMTLLEISIDLRETAELAGLEGDEPSARVIGIRAKEFAELGLEVMRAEGWHAALGDARRTAVIAWSVTIAAIGSDLEKAGLGRLAETGAPWSGVMFDPGAGVAIMRITLAAVVDEWCAGLVDDPGSEDHGWPIVTGRIYGDPRCDDGETVSLHGLPAPDGRTMRGIHMTYDLGRRAETPS